MLKIYKACWERLRIKGNECDDKGEYPKRVATDEDDSERRKAIYIGRRQRMTTEGKTIFKSIQPKERETEYPETTYNVMHGSNLYNRPAWQG